MELYELELQSLIEVKIMRINAKKFSDNKILDYLNSGIKIYL